MQATNASIVVLGTGGTIAGQSQDAQDHVSYRSGELSVADLLGRLPGLAGVAVASEDVARIDSKDMAFEVWQRLASRCAHWLANPGLQGIVITHGTDTLEESAWFLQRVLAPEKPVVLTCAMRPATALSPDGPQNLVDAVVVARTPGARGVVAACAGTVHAAQDVRKVHPYRLDAFSSGDAGPIALVEDGRLRQLREWPSTPATKDLLDKVTVASRWPRVEIVASHAGADPRMVDLLVADGVQGLVVEGTGNGSVHSALEHALVRAMEQGVRVLRTTRCLEGPVVAADAQRLPAHPGSAVKARIDLLLELIG